MKDNNNNNNISSNENNIPITEEIKTLQLVITDLRLDIRKKDDNMRNEKQKFDSVVRDLNKVNTFLSYLYYLLSNLSIIISNIIKQIFQEKELVSKTKQELTERATIEDMKLLKRQLKVLQRVAFSVEADDDNEGMYI